MTSINVLTWNTLWNAMQGKVTDRFGNISNGICPSSYTDPTICFTNIQSKINQLITHNNVSLIGLQESGLLQNMNLPANFEILPLIPSFAGATSSTLIAYDKNIFKNITNIISPQNVVNYTFPPGPAINAQGKPVFGRTFQFVVLQLRSNNKILLFVNTNFAHGADKNKNFDFIDRHLLTTHYDYIVVTGDFNQELSGDINLFNKRLTIHNTHLDTCCDSTLNGQPLTSKKKKIDNILSYGLIHNKISLPISEINNKMFSDHLPLLAEFTLPPQAQTQTQLIYGFDFDGVLQKNMEKIDLPSGKRHPNHTGKMMINDSIRKIIQTTLSKNIKIHIFSGRSNQKDVQNFLDTNFGKENPNIILIDTKDATFNFSTEIQKLTKYYDDSKSVLDQALTLIEQLPKKPELYLVIPEENDSYQVNTKNELEIYFNRVVAGYLINKLVIKVNQNNNAGITTPETTLIDEIINVIQQPTIKRKIIVYQTIYNSKKPETNFQNLVLKPSNKLFIYNENFTHYMNKKYTDPGAGNGFLRPYRQDISNPNLQTFSLGVPTGNHGPIPPNPLLIVDESIKNIKEFIKKNQNIEEVYYSCENDAGILGLNVFKDKQWSIDNIAIITQKLKDMFKELESEIEVEFKLLK
jgi:hypothetical protein